MDEKTIKQMPVMGFPLANLKPEGRIVCRWDCQYESLSKRNKQLETALHEIAAASKIIAKGEDMETALKVMLASYQNIARAALGEKKDG